MGKDGLLTRLITSGPSRVSGERQMPPEFVSSYSKVDEENLPLEVPVSVP